MYSAELPMYSFLGNQGAVHRRRATAETARTHMGWRSVATNAATAARWELAMQVIATLVVQMGIFCFDFLTRGWEAQKQAAAQ